MEKSISIPEALFFLSSKTTKIFVINYLNTRANKNEVINTFDF